MLAPTQERNDEVLRTREAIAHFGRLLFERRLTDGAGGNVSARIGALDSKRAAEEGPRGLVPAAGWCMSPRFAAHRWQWSLRPSQVLVFDAQNRLLRGEGEPSRDMDVHRAIYSALPSAGAIIHAHAPWCQVFAAAGRPIPALLQAAEEVGDVPILEGEDEAAELAASFAARERAVAGFAAAALVRGHGLVVVARDLHHAFDAVERCEGNARCALFAPLLAGADALTTLNARPATAVSST